MKIYVNIVPLTWTWSGNASDVATISFVYNAAWDYHSWYEGRVEDLGWRGDHSAAMALHNAYPFEMREMLTIDAPAYRFWMVVGNSNPSPMLIDCQVSFGVYLRNE